MSAWYWLLHQWSALLGHLPLTWLSEYSYNQHALLAVLLITPVFALLGCLVISNQMAFFSEAIGHSALTGIAIGVVAGLGDPRGSMIAFAVVLAVGISLLRRYSAASTDTIIGLTMSFTVALGVVLLSRHGGFTRYSNFLIGDVLLIDRDDLAGLALLLVVVLALWLLAFNRLFFAVLNHPLATSRGVRVWLMETIFAVVVAVAVTVCIRWVGILIINSLLILPAASARNVAANTRQYQLGAVAFAVVAGVLGLVASNYWDTATGASIVLANFGFFLATLVVKRR